MWQLSSSSLAPRITSPVFHLHILWPQCSVSPQADDGPTYFRKVQSSYPGNCAPESWLISGSWNTSCPISLPLTYVWLYIKPQMLKDSANINCISTLSFQSQLLNDLEIKKHFLKNQQHQGDLKHETQPVKVINFSFSVEMENSKKRMDEYNGLKNCSYSVPVYPEHHHSGIGWCGLALMM